MKKKMLKICCIEWVNASRDKRDLSAAREASFDVAVIAKGKHGDRMRPYIVDGFQVYLCDTRPYPKLPSPINRIISSLQWIKYIRHYNADVLNCHDLIALHMGYIASMMLPKSKKPKLVYDAHEFEIARNMDKKRGKLAAWWVKKSEAYLMKRCAVNVMVNDSIAEETMRIHGLKEKPLVIRNIPERWSLDFATIQSQHNKYMQELDCSQTTFLVMYHGAIRKGRGIEQCLKGIQHLEDVSMILLGDGNESYISEICTLIEELNIKKRVLVQKAAPQTELWKYIGAVDVDLEMVENVCKSYYYMLPNKFFESIQSLTPIICSNFPEVSKLVEKYKIGLVCDPDNSQEISQQIQKLQCDKHYYAKLKENLLKAKEQLCWEKEKCSLVQAYRELSIN